MKLIIMGLFLTLIALGLSCAQGPQRMAEVAPQGTSDGIQVHGHWTVTVTNPDGTVDAVHEFENALSSFGAHLLVALLAGENAIEGWEIHILRYGSTNFNCEESDSKGDSSWKSIPANYASFLDKTANLTKFVMMGSCTVTDLPINESGELFKVYTFADIGLDEAKTFEVVQDGLVKQYDGANGPLVDSKIVFTHKPLAAGHNSDPYPTVINGQSIGITVTITFE